MTAEPVPVTSKLWVFVQLTQHSAYWPTLVAGAARSLGATYTDALLTWVSSRPDVLAGIVLTVTDGQVEPVDAVLERKITTDGAGVDAIILAAVGSYVPPEAP